MIARYALLTSAAFAACAAWAQPNLTAATTVPSAGSDFQVNTYPSYLSAGSAGTDQTYEHWNMFAGTGAAQNPGNQIIKYRDASVSSVASMIPSATLLSTDGGSDTLFWNVTSEGLEQVGSKTQFEGVLNFNDPSLELKLPITYGDSWSDPTGDTYTISGIPVTRIGTISGVADAYGTLELTSAVIYPEVLRVKVRRNIADNSALASTVRIANIHYFYIPTLAYPVVKLVEDSVQISGGAWSVAKSCQAVGNPALVGVNEITPDQITFTAYPNPATNELNIAFAEGRNATTRLEVLDAAGRIVLTRTMTGDRAAMDTQSLGAGHYSVRAFAGDRLIGVRPLVVD